jgi:hypothetical protein
MNHKLRDLVKLEQAKTSAKHTLGLLNEMDYRDSFASYAILDLERVITDLSLAIANQEKRLDTEVVEVTDADYNLRGF